MKKLPSQYIYEIAQKMADKYYAKPVNGPEPKRRDGDWHGFIPGAVIEYLDRVERGDL